MSASLSLETNLVLMAGAGTGKTHGLVTLCLQLLGGAREGRVPLRPSQLCLVTFTEKAAGELRARLRARLERLASGPLSPELEPELRNGFAALGQALPPPSFWRDSLRQLGSAFVGTFHALALQLLRRAPSAMGAMPSGFELLDEQSARELLLDTAERVVLEALEAEEPEAVELCRELDFWDGQGRSGLVPQLVQVFSRLREEGVAPSDVLLGDVAVARASFDAQFVEAKGALAEAVRLDAAKDASLASLLGDIQEVLAGLTWDNFLEREGFRRLEALLRGSKRLSAQRKELGEALKRLRSATLGREDVLGLAAHYAAAKVVPLEQAFKTLLGRLQQRHRETLDRRGFLDFAELLIRARDLLRDEPSARREVHARFQALLVDEFQDTNRLQLELVILLAEKREGGPRPLEGASSAAVTAIPLEPGALCIVGDRKQSIYEFRGADVSVFGELAQKIESEGGRRAFLQDNRRSSPELLSVFNGVFAHWMAAAPDARDYEVAYEPEGDDLRPVRASRVHGPCVDRIRFDPTGLGAEQAREEEAELLARRLAQVLAPEAEPCVDAAGGVRRAEPGDVALLFHRFTQLDTYRRALVRHRIPHRVVRGRGFYGAQEVLDLASLLALIADGEDSLALAAVLRSPWVGASDETLLRLALARKGRLELQALASHEGPEAPRLQEFLAWFLPLQAERDLLSPAEVLSLALEKSGYRWALAAGPAAAQGLANVDKLLALAERWTERRRGDVQRFAAHLVGLAEADPREAEAEPPDHLDRASVQLLTIHQAKGLEWPIVCVPDLAARPKLPPNDSVLYDRTLGLALKPRWDGVLAEATTPRAVALGQEWRRREAAESLRKLYVALTRARDGLVLSGCGASAGGTWRAKLDAVLDLPELAPRVRDLTPESLPIPAEPPPERLAPEPAVLAQAQQLLARVRAPRPQGPPPGAHDVTVEALAEFARCPRRFLFSGRLQLPEPQRTLESTEDLDAFFEAPHAPSDGGGRALLHAALSRLDFLAGPSQLSALLDALGVGMRHPLRPQLEARCRRFLASPFLARVNASPLAPLRDEGYRVELSGRLGVVGRLDLLYQDAEHGFCAVELCAAAHPGPGVGLAPYAVVLETNARAAQALLPGGTPLRSGIVFLDDEAPDFLAAPDHVAVQPLKMIGERLLAAPPGLALPGRPAAECAAIACGHRSRCHAPVGGV